MDDRKNSSSPYNLDVRLGSETAPVVVDAHRADVAGAETLVADALHRSPDAVEAWRTDLRGADARSSATAFAGVKSARVWPHYRAFLEGHSIIPPDRDRAVAMSPS
jgi:hypothetical protein